MFILDKMIYFHSPLQVTFSESYAIGNITFYPYLIKTILERSSALYFLYKFKPDSKSSVNITLSCSGI